MQRSYRYRLYPSKAQVRALQGILEGHRHLYNAALQERQEAWRMRRVSVSYLMQAGQLKELRSFDAEMAALNFSSCQQTLRRLDKAFQAFFRRIREGDKPGYPRFKSRRRFHSVAFVYGDGIRLKGGRLYVQGVGRLRVFFHRPLPDEANRSQVVLKRTAAGEWYAVFQLERPAAQPFPHSGLAVGVDMGLAYFAALSTGELVENPRWLRQGESRLALLQRKQARCRRGSRRYLELGREITRQHERVADRRRDFQHKLSRRLTREFSLIAVEDLNVRGLARSHVAKSVHDAAWSSFLAMLRYKAEEAGSAVVEVEANGTSQVCAGCGCLVPKTLAEREHVCPHCGFTAPRDVNAALVILSRGTARTGWPHKGFPVPVRAGVAGSRLL